jgi:hypothetical protein
MLVAFMSSFVADFGVLFNGLCYGQGCCWLRPAAQEIQAVPNKTVIVVCCQCGLGRLTGLGAFV